MRIKWKAVPVFFSVFIIICLFIYDKNSSLDHLQQKLYALPPDITIEELEGKGFFNLTEIQSGRINTIQRFFNKSVLGIRYIQTFIITQEGPVIRLFYRHPNSNLVSVTTYNVVSQQAENPGMQLNVKCEETEVSDGITEVWLRGFAQNNSPNFGILPYEFLLYRYNII